MLGYHYTTQAAYRRIQYEGLAPATLREHELLEFRKMLPRVPDKVIWVWKYQLERRESWLAATFLALLHQDQEIVLLEIEYGDLDSAAFVYNDYTNGDSVNSYSTFSIGKSSIRRRIELLINTIPPERIEPIWSGDLTECMDAKHIREAEWV